MPQNQEDIDALLAEVSALADEAIADLGVGQPDEDQAAIADETRDRAGASGAQSRDPFVATVHRGGLITADPEESCGRRRDYPERILRLEVPVIVRLAERTMPLSEILSLSTGAIIEFDKSFDSELDLMINNKCVGHGRTVKVAENFGLKVTRLSSVRQRIEAMAGK